jgi:hypothetical protein
MFDDQSNVSSTSISHDSADRVLAAETTGPFEVKRDRFGAIINFSGATAPAVHEIHRRFAAALPERYVAFDHVQRGDAVNHDVYGYDADRDLAVFQVRHFFRRYRNGFANTRKAYFLVGYTETGAPFRHPVSAHTIRAAIRRGADPAEVVQVAEQWIFGVTPKQHARSVRQGDILMFPARGRPASDAKPVGRRLLLLDSHELHAHEILQDAKGEIWAYDPAIYHLKEQHVPLYAPDVDGWWIVRPGREGVTYDFAERLGD